MSLEHSLHTSLVAIAAETIARLDAHPVGGRLVDGSIDRASYVGYLRRVARQVRGTGPMLWDAGARLEQSGRNKLAALFSRKGGEEDGHHLWAENDLAALGERPRADDREPFAAVEAYAAYGRYCAEREPASVMGIAWTLECLGSARAGTAADALVERAEIANIASAVTFLRGHGDADTSHVDALREAFVEITDQDEADGIVLAARFTARVYLSFFEA